MDTRVQYILQGILYHIKMAVSIVNAEYAIQKCKFFVFCQILRVFLLQFLPVLGTLLFCYVFFVYVFVACFACFDCVAFFVVCFVLPHMYLRRQTRFSPTLWRIISFAHNYRTYSILILLNYIRTFWAKPSSLHSNFTASKANNFTIRRMASLRVPFAT